MKKRKVESEHRVIAHIDLDCFYVQVERSINPNLKGIPVAVVQYDPFGDLRSLGANDNRIIKKGGGLIAVSYEARAKGVKRNVRGGDAKHSCPELVLVQVPTSHGKADLTIYRDASAKIVTVLASRYPSCTVERASIDEVYLDVTNEATSLLELTSNEQLLEFIQTLIAVPTTIAGEDAQEIHLSRAELRRGHEGASEHMKETDIRSSWFSRPINEWTLDDKLLLCGSMIIYNLRKDVFDQLGFTCSGGIANNKMLAKLASGMHKPNKQTIVPNSVIADLMKSLPLSRIQGLGGKLGKGVRLEFGDRITTMGDLLLIDRSELIEKFGEEATTWMINAASGIDKEPVQDRTLVVSIGCSKSYASSNMLTPDNMNDGVILRWYTELAEELVERVRSDTAANSRMPKNLTVGLGVTPYNEADEVEREEVRKMLNSTMGAQARRNEISSTFSVCKTVPMVPSATAEAVAKTALSVAQRALSEHPRMLTPALMQGMYRITGLSLGANNFIDVAVGAKSISSFFKSGVSEGTNIDKNDIFDKVAPCISTAVGSKRNLISEDSSKNNKLAGFYKPVEEGSSVDLFALTSNKFNSVKSETQNKSSPVKNSTGGISSFFTSSSSSNSKVDLFASASTTSKPTAIVTEQVKPSIASFFNSSRSGHKIENSYAIDLTSTDDEYEVPNDNSNDVWNHSHDNVVPASFQDIDPEVFASLPIEIQQELKASLRATK